MPVPNTEEARESISCKKLEITVNGVARSCSVRPGESLLEVLRERFGILSPKDGCRPQGQCGCCLVLVDGKPKVSCAVPAAKAAGHEVLTLEGLGDDERELIARCFVAAAGLQCGYCIPGIAMQAHRFLERNPQPTRDEIAKAMNGHLCRCTGYVKILDAIELLAAARRGGAKPNPHVDGGVGDDLERYGGHEMVLGDRAYVADLRPEGLLHGAVVLSEHARARVLSIDLERARSLPGVVAIACAEHVPGERWYGLIEKDWPGIVAIGEEVRCVGDIVAVIAAEDEATARMAATMVEVEYEVLEPVLDAFVALSEDSPRVNPKHENVLSRTILERGDADHALASSAHRVRDTWRTQRIEHLFLEPESALALPLEDGRLHLYTQGQGIFDDRRQVAAFLGETKDRIFVELVPNGGAFGGKEDMSIQAHACLLARMTDRPVRLTLSREESIRMHPKRHPLTMEYDVGCDSEGRLTAVKARMVGDSGAYASVGAKVLERAAGHACGPYRVDNVDLVATAVYTNNPPCGAMRGFGANQAHFGIEGAMDLLAEKVGISGWEMRWRNALEVGDTYSTGQILDKSVGIKQTLQSVREIYDAAQAEGRAVGIACGLKNSGLGNGAREFGKARLVVEKDGTISLFNGFTEMGQGLLTILVQCAVEETGLEARTFRPKVDATFDLDCGQTTGSRGTLLSGRAVAEAARKLRKELDRGSALEDLVGQVFEGEILIDDTTAPGQEVDRVKTHTSFGFATQLCILDEQGRVDRMVAAHDVGKALNPSFVEGQIEGAVHMGLGYALTEDLPCPDGMPATFKLREIGVLRAKDMPEVEVILIEEHEPEGPYGAKGVGEIGLVPTAAAVAGALAAYDGVRRTTLPMKDSPAARAMSVGRIRSR